MCGNRVEELESRVNELEASVEGLTDELVECKVRLRELENIVDDDSGLAADDEDVAQAAEAAVSETTETTESSPADTPKSEATKAADNREESEADSGSDIIVA